MPKEEIEKRIRQILSNVPDEYKVRKLVNLVKESIQRFIEETRIKEGKKDKKAGVPYNYAVLGRNEAIKSINQKQAKWLKDNLN